MRDALHGGVLIQAVADIAVIEVARAGEREGVVALAAAGDLPGRLNVALYAALALEYYRIHVKFQSNFVIIKIIPMQ